MKTKRNEVKWSSAVEMQVHFETAAIRERAATDKQLSDEERAALIEHAPAMARTMALRTQKLFEKEREDAQRKLGAERSIEARGATKADRAERIRKLKAEGKAPKEIAAALGVSEATISRAK